jgi:hypothetical protein
MSRQSVHNLYNRPSAHGFRRAFEAALDCSLVLVEDGVWSRAINGVARPIFYKGEQVGEYRQFDERLAMFLLRFRRPHRFGELPRVPPADPPPEREGLGPDPDEAVGTLDSHLGNLVDEAELADAPVEESRGDDGVNFVNFVGFERESPAVPNAGNRDGAKSREGVCGQRPRQSATRSASRDSLA